MKKLFFYISIVLLTLNFYTTVFAKQLLESSHSWDGGDIAYPEGDAQITVLELTLKAGQSTQFHCHPVPNFGHLIKGKLKVETIKGEQKIMQTGDTIIEVMKTIHRGTALEDTEIRVYYAGAEGVPHTVFADADDARKYCEI